MNDSAKHRILLSAYACEPGRGSEPGVGWNWALSLVGLGHEVWVLTRANNRQAIERALGHGLEAENRLHFIYFDLPAWARRWKKGGFGTQIYYALWQRCVLSLAKRKHQEHKFSIVHHITFGVWRQPSHLYRLGVPMIFGPVGGGESAPQALVRTLPAQAMLAEWARDGVNWLSLLNPSLRECMRRAVLVVAKTPETARWIARCGTRADTSIEIGIDAARLRARDSTEQQTGALRCIYAGRLVGLKGVHLAIDAVARARSAGADVSLTIVGQGPMLRSLQGQVDQLELAQKVEFIPWLSQTELFTRFREHDVLLFPSLHDSSGNVVLEAFAHGLPCICLDLGGPAVLVNESTGVVVQSRGQRVSSVLHGLSFALVTLAHDRARLRDLSLAAREKALAMGWVVVAARTYAALAESSNGAVLDHIPSSHDTEVALR